MRRSWLGVAAVLILTFAADRALAQNKEDVSFKTFDGVLIKGTFYSSVKGGNSPTVMLLHKYGAGNDRTKGEWDTLAKQLQEKGNNVLSFDFRGHGGSTTIADTNKFWACAWNRDYIKNWNVKKASITVKDFKNGYLPYLVNDIVAARYDLDNRNDNGQTNTSNIFIIGAEEGAALGLFWMTVEAARPAVYSKLNLFQIGGNNTSPASEDIAGAIFLTFTRSPNRITFPYTTFLRINDKMRASVPMWFAAGADDNKDPNNGMADARYMYDNVFHADNVKPKLDLTSRKEIVGTKLKGIQLVSPGKTKTDELIEAFIKKATEKRPNTSQKKRNTSETEPAYVPLAEFGFIGYP